MSRLVELISSRHAPHVVVLALVSVAFAGCSADTSTRMSEFSNPFAEQGPRTTGSVAQNTYQPPRQELPQYQRPAPVVSAPLSYPVKPAASYTPPPAAPIETTSAVAPRSVAAAPGGWSREGGTRIIVGSADTLDIISRRYNVPSAEILRANGMSGPRMLQPGQQLVIPRHMAQAHLAPPPVSAPSPAPAPAPIAARVGGDLPAKLHVVSGGETLMSISRRYKVPPAQLAVANNMTVKTHLKVGMKIAIPGVAAGKVASAASPAPVMAEAPKPAPAPVVAAPTPKVVAAAAPAEPQQKVRVATEAKDLPEAQSPVKAADTTSALPTFRWPVRGRVIAAYGAKTNGKQNDGINVAVPEGTPVKAAEDGVVAYAGNELKGYGNLVLVRHSNGYVTAYAHASELMVKRGDTIKRGQVIAKSGQTGEVGSPQLHFEIRKGSAAVDPLQFLNGA